MTRAEALADVCMCVQGALDMVNAQYAIELDTEGFTVLAFDPGHVLTDSGFRSSAAFGLISDSLLCTM